MRVTPAGGQVDKAGVLRLGKVIALVVAAQALGATIADLDAKQLENFMLQGYLLRYLTPGSRTFLIFLLLTTSFLTLILARLAPRGGSPTVLLTLLPLSVTVYGVTTLTEVGVLSGIIQGTGSTLLQVATAGILVLVVVDVIHRGRTRFLTPALTLLICSEIGGYLALALSFEGVLTLIAALSLFDLYTFVRGSPRKFDNSEGGEPVPIIASGLRGLTLGVSDFGLYSLLATVAWRTGELGKFVVCATCINAGVLLTLTLPIRRRPIPGAPLPMALGLLAFFLYP